MDFSGRLAPVERPELFLVFPVFSPKERIHMSKSFAVGLGLPCQNCLDVGQSAFLVKCL
jgi:hypothetical protein